MALALSMVLIYFLAAALYRSSLVPVPTTLSAYYSFGVSCKVTDLEKAFFVTNASFSTAFVSLILFVPNQGILALVTPLSFVFGTLFYANILLPQHFELLLSGKRYPELMASSSKSSFVRIIVSLYVVFSLWLFTYTEIQAFITFIAGDSNGYMTTASLFFGIVICATMGIYVARSGLSGVIASDESQFHAITIGSLALLVLVLISAFGEGYEKLTAIFFSQTAMIRSYPYTSLISLLIDTLAGFAFCQLLYYDNWQRISAYSALRALSDHNAS